MWSPAPKSVLLSTLTRLVAGSVSKDLPKVGESFQASPAKTPLGSPWRVAQPLGPAAAPLLRVIQNQQRSCQCPVPAVMAVPPSSWTTPLWSGPTLTPPLPTPTRTSLLTGWAQTLWCSHHSGDLAVPSTSSSTSARINNLWCIEFL